MPNDKQPTPGHVAMLTNQMLVYKLHPGIPRIVIPRTESIAKTPKLNPKINLGISSDLVISKGLSFVSKTGHETRNRKVPTW